MKGIFITGTDTGVGKTYVTLACIDALQSAGLHVGAMKPVASGAERINGCLRNDDALQIQQALDHAVDYELINPYCFAAPVSPHIAAAEAGVNIELDIIQQRFDTVCADADYALVEGVGGWLAPLSNSLTVADLAAVLGLPVVLVVGMRLGCLNHAVLTADAIRASGLELAGWLANCLEPDLNGLMQQLDYLDQALHMPPLAVLQWQQATSLSHTNLPGLQNDAA